LIVLKRRQPNGDLFRRRRVQQAAEPDLIGGHHNLSRGAAVIDIQNA
jgi:hypothetical protein